MSVTTKENALGTYLRIRRARLDPTALGFPSRRRRTPGLRREEVAQLAHVSATWYTWLEQGRGGAPSADVLDRLARALMLTEVEREHLFLLALDRPPEVRYRAAEGVTPRLQRILDALELCPAFVKTAAWDVVAWNPAAAAVFTDYGALPADQRNILRMMFSGSHIKSRQTDWKSVARFVVASFRADVTRAGAAGYVKDLVEELCLSSLEFAALWRENDVRAHGEGTKHIRHPLVGQIGLEYSVFAVDGRPDLGLVIYTPVTPADVRKVKSLLAPQTKTPPPRRTRRPRATN